MPKILKDLCINCKTCYPYCPMGAIKLGENGTEIDEDECVEGGICYQKGICPRNAIVFEELKWPRILRAEFSNPLFVHKTTGVTGRGTEEMKTNDVTNKFNIGFVGLGVEMGRPGIGSRFYDIQKVTKALSSIDGVHFEEQNPLVSLMVNSTGELKEDILNEKVLSAIIEVEFPFEKTEEVLKTLKRVEGEVSTIFSVSIISRVYPDGTIPAIDIPKSSFMRRLITSLTTPGSV